ATEPDKPQLSTFTLTEQQTADLAAVREWTHADELKLGDEGEPPKFLGRGLKGWRFPEDEAQIFGLQGAAERYWNDKVACEQTKEAKREQAKKERERFNKIADRAFEIANGSKLPNDAAARFIKVCEMLTSDFDGERANAALAATNILRQHNLTWHD